MKKFTKVCLIIAAVLVIIGTGAIVVGAAMGGGLRNLPVTYFYNGGWFDNPWNEVRDEWHDAWNEARGDVYEVREEFDEFKTEWDESWNELGEDWRGEIAAIPDEIKQDLEQDFVLEESYDYVDIRKLDIEISLGSVHVLTSEETDKIQVQIGSGAGDYHLETEDGDELKLKMTRRRNRPEVHVQGRPIKILVPEGYQFDSVEVQVNAGMFSAEELLARELEVDLKAGIAFIDQGEVEKLETDCAAGIVYYNGSASREVSAECAAGSMGINLSEEETYYDYEISAAAGSITVGAKSYTGLGQKKRITNDASVGEMELKCSAGDLSVTFAQ